MNNKGPLVSICTSTHNSEKIIEDTILSIVNQTYDNKEYIIVDDCSSDSTREILSRYSDLYEWIKVIYLPENLHVVNASNIAYHHFNGKYFAGCGHDDIWLPDKLEKQVEFMETHTEYGVCFTQCEIIDEFGNAIYGGTPLVDLFNQPNRTQKEWANRLLTGNQFCVASALVRTACMGEKEYYQYGLLQLQDYELWLRLVKDYKFYVMQEQLTKYRWFQKEKTNLSYLNQETSNRLYHEEEYIIYKYISSLTDKQMLDLYQERFRNPASHTHEEIVCEKAFLLLSLHKCHTIDFFIDILDNEKTRNVLKESFGYSLQDFYRDNAKGFLFDNEMYSYALGFKRELDQFIADGKQRAERADYKKTKKYAILRTLNFKLSFEQFILSTFSRLLYAVDNSLIPIIDTKYFPVEFMNTNSGNSFYTYFSGVENEIDDIYCLDSSVVEMLEPIECMHEKYKSYSFDLLSTAWITEENIESLGIVYNKYLSPSEVMINRIKDQSIMNDILMKRTLGIRISSGDGIKDMESYIDCIDGYMRQWKCECMYLSGASPECIQIFSQKFGDNCITLIDSGETIEDYIGEAEILANCDSMMGALDVVTIMAIMRNSNRFKYIDLYEK